MTCSANLELGNTYRKKNTLQVGPEILHLNDWMLQDWMKLNMLKQVQFKQVHQNSVQERHRWANQRIGQTNIRKVQRHYVSNCLELLHSTSAANAQQSEALFTHHFRFLTDAHRGDLHNFRVANRHSFITANSTEGVGPRARTLAHWTGPSAKWHHFKFGAQGLLEAVKSKNPDH